MLNAMVFGIDNMIEYKHEEHYVGLLLFYAKLNVKNNKKIFLDKISFYFVKKCVAQIEARFSIKVYSLGLEESSMYLVFSISPTLSPLKAINILKNGFQRQIFETYPDVKEDLHSIFEDNEIVRSLSPDYDLNIIIQSLSEANKHRFEILRG